MSLIKLVTPILDDNDLDKFKFYIRKDKLNDARLLVETNMNEYDGDEPEHIILNEVYDELINEIEMTLDGMSGIDELV